MNLLAVIGSFGLKLNIKLLLKLSKSPWANLISDLITTKLKLLLNRLIPHVQLIDSSRSSRHNGRLVTIIWAVTSWPCDKLTGTDTT